MDQPTLFKKHMDDPSVNVERYKQTMEVFKSVFDRAFEASLGELSFRVRFHTPKYYERNVLLVFIAAKAGWRCELVDMSCDSRTYTFSPK